jgi:hypothetical protein
VSAWKLKKIMAILALHEAFVVQFMTSDNLLSENTIIVREREIKGEWWLPPEIGKIMYLLGSTVGGKLLASPKCCLRFKEVCILRV